MDNQAKKYIKLGTETDASLFYDQATGVKVLPGQIVEIPAEYLRSTRTVEAMRNGHIMAATEDEFKAAQTMAAEKQAQQLTSMETFAPAVTAPASTELPGGTTFNREIFLNDQLAELEEASVSEAVDFLKTQPYMKAKDFDGLVKKKKDDILSRVKQRVSEYTPE